MINREGGRCMGPVTVSPICSIHTGISLPSFTREPVYQEGRPVHDKNRDSECQKFQIGQNPGG